jgi:GAF domain-containing protein
VSAQHIEAVMGASVDAAARLAPAGGAVVEIAHADELVYAAVSGSAAGMVGQRVDVDGSLSGLALRSGVVLVCEDSARDPRVDGPACRAVGLRSMVVAPLVAEGRPFGILKALSARPYAFDATSVATLEAIARDLSSALARDVEDVRRLASVAAPAAAVLPWL